ncbi:helix-turn-helix domain-containing protein [Georgenia sp. H159]|uniref:AraC-like ligand-binding domain-containing protein n=1 Tax=Georgenia sp. H159 TaxID=3076115 RepID=UPI002D77F651|nr:helix-turn-helix domain-containing protein [Georgenia sp. H159]
MTVTLAPSAPTLEQCAANTFGEWVDLIGSRFVRLNLSTPDPAVFNGELRSLAIEGTHISDIRAGAHRVERRETDVLPSDPRHLKVTLQLRGTGVVAQDGREAVLHAGDVAIYDTCRPYTLEYSDDMRTLVMVFPHQTLGVSAGLVHNLTAVRLSGDSGIGRVISPFMQHVAENLDQLTGANGSRIVRSALDLLTAMLSEELVEHHAPEEPWKRILDAVQQYIDSHLDDPELSAAKVAREHYVSLRYLQYLFHQEGQTVSGYIRQRRLERCRLDLQDPALQDQSILRVAQTWGFTDPSHFSKVFKAAYATSPREYRARFEAQREARRAAAS